MPSLVNRFFFQIRSRQSLDSCQLCHTSPYISCVTKRLINWLSPLSEFYVSYVVMTFLGVGANKEHIPRLETTNVSAVQLVNCTGCADHAITYLSEDEIKMLSEQELDTHSLYIGHIYFFVHPAHFFKHLAQICCISGTLLCTFGPYMYGTQNIYCT